MTESSVRDEPNLVAFACVSLLSNFWGSVGRCDEQSRPWFQSAVGIRQSAVGIRQDQIALDYFCNIKDFSSKKNKNLFCSPLYWAS